MDAILDTHTFLWFVQDNPQLSPIAKAYLMDGRNNRWLSSGSIFEIGIKLSLPGHRSPIQINCSLDEFLDVQMAKHKIMLMPIEPIHVARLSVLPYMKEREHNDPFDRLIIAQSLVLDIPIIGRDEHFDQYGVKRIW